ncbi:hypothetical protein G4O51_07290 [Candidatus Bathyarchaeota archaeon A05DMB-2]|jgi:hypothetical protein|nr:hypothetical protein [Candidatus Bathyarchaeota archaeon A05DMB-2]
MHCKNREDRKKIPEKTNMGTYPTDSVMIPAYNREINSASLIGTWSKPMSTETAFLFLVAFAIMDSKNPIPSPSATANAKNKPRK